MLTTVALVVMPLSGIARQRASCLRASERRGEERTDAFPSYPKGAVGPNCLDTQGSIKLNKL